MCVCVCVRKREQEMEGVRLYVGLRFKGIVNIQNLNGQHLLGLMSFQPVR